MNLAMHRTTHMPSANSPKIHDGKGGGIQQEDFTRSLGRNNSGNQEGIGKTIQKMQEHIDGFFKIAIAMAKNPSLNENNQSEQTVAMTQLMGASTNAQAAKVTALSAEMQHKYAAIQQANIVGKAVKVPNTRNFVGNPGEKIAFKFDIAKNIPKNATIIGTVKVLDERKRLIFKKTNVRMHAGSNEFTWDGLTDLGKVAEAGGYSIKVDASYKIPGSNTSTPAIVNTMTEGVVREIDIKEGRITLTDGTILNVDDVAKYYDKAEVEKENKSQTPNFDASKAANYIGKNVILNENKVDFEGNRMNKLGFYSNKGIKGAKVKVVVTKDREVQSIEIREMDIKDGRNVFNWSGDSTKTEADLEAKKEGKTFSQIPYGEYEYRIEISEESGPWRKAAQEGEVFVEGIHSEDGKSMLAIEGGGLVSEKLASGFAKESTKPDMDALTARAASFAGKRIEVPRMAVLEGNGAATKYVPIGFSSETELSIKAKYFDQNGKEIREITVSEAEVNAALMEVLKYDNLTDASKTEFKKWLGNQSYWEFDPIYTNPPLAVEYANVHKNNKDIVDQHILAEIKAGNYEMVKGIPQPATELLWDGKDTSGAKVDPGHYAYELYYIEREKKPGGSTSEHKFSDNVDMFVNSVRVDDEGRIMAQITDRFEQSRLFEITENTVFKA